MNCEQVEELLSAYLDNMLAPEERRAVAAHLQTCRSCSEALADYRRNDSSLAHLPRVSPDPALRERIFSSPEYLELIDTAPDIEALPEWTIPLPAKSPRRDTPGRPHLVAIPGGRSTVPGPTVRIETPRRKRRGGFRIMIAAIAAALIVAIGIGALLGASELFHQAPKVGVGGFTPPAAGPQGTGPLSAGVRFVFLRGGTLWSERADGSSTQPDRLTPNSVTVADHWVVSAVLPGRAAGDMLAYIDLQKAYVHIIRSDGQEDTVINQPLLKAGISPASVWDTDAGTSILNSLTWSPDGSKLAFVADPAGTGQTHLYLYSMVTHNVTQVPLTTQGSVSHATWSPDGVRLAYEVSQQSVTSILDYNTQNHGTLTVADGIGSRTTAGDSVLSLDWSPDVDLPAITWSVGSIGHVHSLWVYHVAVDSSAAAQDILTGDFAQAIYGHSGSGSWLVIMSNAGQAGDIWRIDVTSGANFTRLTRGKQVNFAEWSPDGSYIGYLDALSAGVGAFHIVNASTAIDTTVTNGVAYQPAPAWSLNSQQIAFSTGTQVGIASAQAAASHIHFLPLKGAPSALAWSAASTQQLVVAMNDGQQGIYLVDTQHDSALRVDSFGTDGAILWTEIP